jgi:hypothetical protein
VGRRTLLVTVEVPQTDHHPHVRHVAYPGRLQNDSPIHEPDRIITRFVPPENVAFAVTGEVLGPDQCPICRSAVGTQFISPPD